MATTVSSHQTHDDGVGSGSTHSKTAGYVPGFSLDNGDTEASKLRRSFTSRIPTTLLFASEDASLDFGTFNQTTIHTLEIADGAHVVLTAPGLGGGAVSEPAVASVTSVHRLTGDGYGRLRVSKQTTLIVREEDLDYEFGQQFGVEVMDDASASGVTQIVEKTVTTMGKTFDLRVHLAIEHGGRVVSPKTVTAGGLNVPMRHHWAGVWSGPENFILENMQEVVVAASRDKCWRSWQNPTGRISGRFTWEQGRVQTM